jgi:hypothetical protein
MTVTPKFLDHLLTATKEQLETSIRMAHKRYIQREFLPLLLPLYLFSFLFSTHSSIVSDIQKTGFLGFLLRGRQPSVELSKVALDFNLLDRCPLRRKLVEKFSIINTGGSDIHVALSLKCATNTFSLKIDHQSALIPPGGKKEFEASLIALYPTEINAALIFTINGRIFILSL